MNLHHRQGGQTRSRQAPIPQGRKIDEASLFDLAKILLSQIVSEGRVWPCSNLSLAVAGFEEGIVGNMGIGAFLVKGDEAKAINSASREAKLASDRPEKRQRLDSPAGIHRFLVKTDSVDEYDEDFGADNSNGVSDDMAEDQGADSDGQPKAVSAALPSEEGNREDTASDHMARYIQTHQHRITAYVCERCNDSLGSAEALQSHQDWHFAKDLQKEDRGTSAHSVKPSSAYSNKKLLQNSNKKKPSNGKVEKGQTKLAFG